MLEKEEEKNQKQPMRCWLVEIALTSGDTLRFYVTAIDQKEAYRKADEYAETAAGNEKLKNFYGRGFIHLP